MQELIQRFGQYQNLYGIFTKPEIDTNKPCVMIINAGAVHKAGPFNLHVLMARHLATLGFSSFRFDLSGQGESQKIPSAKSHHEQVIEDMQSALDCLEQTFQQTNVISFGLCTGAENAHKIAVSDTRIKGLICVDGYGYLTPKFKRVRILNKLSKPYALFKSILMRLFKNRKSLDANSSPETIDSTDNFAWKLPEKSSYQEDMRILNQRAIPCLYVYSGGVQSYYNYEGQMADAFKGEEFIRLIEEVYYPRSDHTFFVSKDKRALFNRLVIWLEQRT